jgi:hypothetical protein
MTEINKDAEGNLTAATFPFDKVERVVQESIKERSVTAIVREDSPETHRRWDREYDRNKKLDRATSRANAIGLAISAVRDDPSVSNFLVDLDEDGNRPKMDYYGTYLLPLADRIHDYITQDEE